MTQSARALRCRVVERCVLNWLEFWGVGAALAGMIVTASLWMGLCVRRLAGEMPDLRDCMARLEGLVEGSTNRETAQWASPSHARSN